MRRVIVIACGTLLVVISALLAARRFGRGAQALKFDEPYQAVLLDNRQVYYGKLQGLSGEYCMLTDVYYVEHQVNPQTKEVKNVLVRRGTEWHAPDRMVINAHHIVLVEPVSPSSKVAELISDLKSH